MWKWAYFFWVGGIVSALELDDYRRRIEVMRKCMRGEGDDVQFRTTTMARTDDEIKTRTPARLSRYWKTRRNDGSALYQ